MWREDQGAFKKLSEPGRGRLVPEKRQVVDKTRGHRPRPILERALREVWLAVLSLANLPSANNLLAVPKARMFPEHTVGEISVEYPSVADGAQALLDWN